MPATFRLYRMRFLILGLGESVLKIQLLCGNPLTVRFDVNTDLEAPCIQSFPRILEIPSNSVLSNLLRAIRILQWLVFELLRRFRLLLLGLFLLSTPGILTLFGGFFRPSNIVRILRCSTAMASTYNRTFSWS